MPIVTHEIQTKGGRHVVRCQVNGHITGQDATDLLEKSKALAKRIGAKGDLLSNIAAGTDYSPESRRIFTSDFVPYTRRTAAVVTSRIVRAAINFMTRMSLITTEVKCFDDEASALAWLDE